MAEYIMKEQAELIVESALREYIRTGAVETAFEKLYSLPDADVVEVVRCKDCRYFTPQAGWGGGQCSYLEDKFELPEVLIFDDDYCSDGERKDGGESDD